MDLISAVEMVQCSRKLKIDKRSRSRGTMVVTRWWAPREWMHACIDCYTNWYLMYVHHAESNKHTRMSADFVHDEQSDIHIPFPPILLDTHTLQTK